MPHPNSIEQHPFEPFLPANAKVLLLGSFPPQPKRWSMAFYYPNLQNDFWRICGLLFFHDKNTFIIEEEKRFDLDRIMAFCTDKGIALYDTATAIRRLKENASDKFLEVVTQTNIPTILKHIPNCRTLVTTGQKATETLCSILDCKQPSLNQYTPISISNKTYNFYRMPSTSRAYPLSLEKKADAYKAMFRNSGLL